MFAALIVMLLTLHLAAVSVAAMAPFFCLWLEWRESRHAEPVAGDLGRLLARRALDLLLVGAVLGLIQLGLLGLAGQGEFFRALSSIESSRWWFAALELAFSFVALAIYLATWTRWRRWRPAHAAIAFIAATNLAYHFPTLFVITGIVAERPDLWSQQVEIRQLLADPDVLARIAHFLLAAVALTAAGTMWLASRQGASARHYALTSARVALASVVLQLPLGVVVLSQLAEPIRQQLLGADLAGTLFLCAGLAFSIYLMHTLATAALGEPEAALARRSVALLLLVFLSMIAARHRMRDANSGILDAKQLTTFQQHQPIDSKAMHAAG